MLVAAVAVTLFVVFGDAAEQGKVLAQYDYQFTMPQDWSQVGGDPQQREAQIAPAAGESGASKITVQERRLVYNSDADRARAVGQLRAEYERQARSNFSDFDESANFAGRDIVYYRQRINNATVDWYVFFKGTAQVSVGCQYSGAGSDGVEDACAQVVRTMTIG